jgi:hypothetical protein
MLTKKRRQTTQRHVAALDWGCRWLTRCCSCCSVNWTWHGEEEEEVAEW